MRKVIRLSELDLQRIVKRVIQEQNEKTPIGFRISPSGSMTAMSDQECFKTVTGKFIDIIKILKRSNALTTSFFSNTDEEGVKKAFSMIDSQSDLIQLNKYLNCFFNTQLHEPPDGVEFFNWVAYIFYYTFKKITDFMDTDIRKSIESEFKSKNIRMMDPQLGESPEGYI